MRVTASLPRTPQLDFEHGSPGRAEGIIANQYSFSDLPEGTDVPRRRHEGNRTRRSGDGVGGVRWPLGCGCSANHEPAELTVDLIHLNSYTCLRALGTIVML